MTWIVSALLLFSLPALAAPKVIYGNDDRYEPAAYPLLQFQTASQSTAALIDPQDLVAVSGQTYEVRGTSLRDWGICSSERFIDQPTTASCSAFLVKDNVLVTAGHCTTDTSCEGNVVVFGYRLVGAVMNGPVKVEKKNIYKCKKILERKLEDGSGNDYAVIELDRKVTDFKPLSYRRSGAPAVGADLVVIGHPTGLPTKIADGAKIKTINNIYFTGNLDTYGGNSGSAVFDKKTGLVEGILVRGETDYVFGQQPGCRVSNVLPDTYPNAEQVTRITNIQSLR